MLLLALTVHLVAVIQLILLFSPARSAQLRTGSAGGRSDGSRLRFIHEVREVSSVYLEKPKQVFTDDDDQGRGGGSDDDYYWNSKGRDDTDETGESYYYMNDGDGNGDDGGGENAEDQTDEDRRLISLRTLALHRASNRVRARARKSLQQTARRLVPKLKPRTGAASPSAILARKAAQHKQKKAIAATNRNSANKARRSSTKNEDLTRKRGIATARASQKPNLGGKVRAPNTRAAQRAAASKVKHSKFGTGSTAKAPTARNANGGRSAIVKHFKFAPPARLGSGGSPTPRLSATNRKRGGNLGAFTGLVRGKKRAMNSRSPSFKRGIRRRTNTSAPTTNLTPSRRATRTKVPSSASRRNVSISRPTVVVRQPSGSSVRMQRAPSGKLVPVRRPSRPRTAPTSANSTATPTVTVAPTRIRRGTQRPSLRSSSKSKPILTLRPSPRSSPRPSGRATLRPSSYPTPLPTARPSPVTQMDTAGISGTDRVGTPGNPAPLDLPPANSLAPPRQALATTIQPTWPFYLEPPGQPQHYEQLDTKFGMTAAEVKSLYTFLCDMYTCTGRVFLRTDTQQVNMRLLDGRRNLSLPIFQQRAQNSQWLADIMTELSMDGLSFNLWVNRALRFVLFKGLLPTNDSALFTDEGKRVSGVESGINRGIAVLNEASNCGALRFPGQPCRKLGHGNGNADMIRQDRTSEVESEYEPELELDSETDMAKSADAGAPIWDRKLQAWTPRVPPSNSIRFKPTQPGAARKPRRPVAKKGWVQPKPTSAGAKIAAPRRRTANPSLKPSRSPSRPRPAPSTSTSSTGDDDYALLEALRRRHQKKLKEERQMLSLVPTAGPTNTSAPTTRPPTQTPTRSPTLITQNYRVTQLSGLQLYLTAQYSPSMVGTATSGRVSNVPRIERLMSVALQDRGLFQEALRAAASESTNPVIKAMLSNVLVVEIKAAQPTLVLSPILGLYTMFEPSPRPSWTPPNRQLKTWIPTVSALQFITAPPSAKPSLRPSSRPGAPTGRPTPQPSRPSARPTFRPTTRPTPVPTTAAPTFLPSRIVFAVWEPPSPPSPLPTLYPPPFSPAPSAKLGVNAAGSASSNMSPGALTAVIVFSILLPIVATAAYYFCFSSAAKERAEAKKKAKDAKDYMLKMIKDEEAELRRPANPANPTSPGSWPGPGPGSGFRGAAAATDAASESDVRMSVDEMRVSLHEFYTNRAKGSALGLLAQHCSGPASSASPGRKQSTCLSRSELALTQRDMYRSPDMFAPYLLSSGVAARRASAQLLTLQAQSAHAASVAAAASASPSTSTSTLASASVSASGDRRYTFDPPAIIPPAAPTPISAQAVAPAPAPAAAAPAKFFSRRTSAVAGDCEKDKDHPSSSLHLTRSMLLQPQHHEELKYEY